MHPKVPYFLFVYLLYLSCFQPCFSQVQEPNPSDSTSILETNVLAERFPTNVPSDGDPPSDINCVESYNLSTLFQGLEKDSLVLSMTRVTTSGGHSLRIVARSADGGGTTIMLLLDVIIDTGVSDARDLKDRMAIEGVQVQEKWSDSIDTRIVPVVDPSLSRPSRPSNNLGEIPMKTSVGNTMSEVPIAGPPEHSTSRRQVLCEFPCVSPRIIICREQTAGPINLHIFDSTNSNSCVQRIWGMSYKLILLKEQDRLKLIRIH